MAGELGAYLSHMKSMHRFSQSVTEYLLCARNWSYRDETNIVPALTGIHRLIIHATVISRMAAFGVGSEGI